MVLATKTTHRMRHSLYDPTACLSQPPQARDVLDLAPNRTPGPSTYHLTGHKDLLHCSPQSGQ
jgi:hypothetical protein